MLARHNLRVAGHLVFEKWPFFALTIIFCVLTFVVQKNGAAISSMDRTGTYARLANVIMSYLRYLAKVFWPTDLAVLYPFPVSERSYLALWPDWQLIAGVLVLLLISINPVPASGKCGPALPWAGFGFWAQWCRSSGSFKSARNWYG